MPIKIKYLVNLGHGNHLGIEILVLKVLKVSNLASFTNEDFSLSQRILFLSDGTV
jgi:hypothetical protein